MIKGSESRRYGCTVAYEFDSLIDRSLSRLFHRKAVWPTCWTYSSLSISTVYLISTFVFPHLSYRGKSVVSRHSLIDFVGQTNETQLATVFFKCVGQTSHRHIFFENRNWTGTLCLCALINSRCTADYIFTHSFDLFPAIAIETKSSSSMIIFDELFYGFLWILWIHILMR